MKVLYVASRGATETSLMLEREITEIQTRALTSSPDVPRFKFLPDLPLEELSLVLSKEEPDVLHISAHGERDALTLAAAHRDPIPLSGPLIRTLLSPEKPPRLVYLNACNSSDIAKELTTVVPMAIGTTAPVSNRAALAGVVLFYNRLIKGFTVHNAHEAARGLIEALDGGKTTSVLHSRDGIQPDHERLHHVARIAARFTRKEVKVDDEGQYPFYLGIVGCRPDTTQIVIFTDDASYITNERDLETDLCLVIRGTPVRGTMWSDFEWSADGDMRLFAAGVTAGGDTFVLSSTLCQALEEGARSQDRQPLKPPQLTSFRRALDRLRRNDGSGAPDG
jgi:CHAT domain